MFRPVISENSNTVIVTVDGKPVNVAEGATVTAALMGYGEHKDCRCSFVSGERRAPYCHMGVCHECLVEIDGKPNQQACIRVVEEGMQIQQQAITEAVK